MFYFFAEEFTSSEEKQVIIPEKKDTKLVLVERTQQEDLESQLTPNDEEKKLLVKSPIIEVIENKIPSINKEESLQTSICIADTDEDTSSTTHSTTNAPKEEKITQNKTHRHNASTPIEQRKGTLNSSRVKEATPETTNSNTTPVTTTRTSNSRRLRVLAETETFLEAPTTVSAFDDDSQPATDYINQQRLRRRYSSTPVIESIPNSPASSDRDDKDTKVPKKLLLSIYNTLHCSKNAAILQTIISGGGQDSGGGLKVEEVCLRPMNFQTIKKNIDSGAIRTIIELQRDVFLMCQNAFMVTKTNSSNYKSLLAFFHECQAMPEFLSTGISPLSVVASTLIDRHGSTTKSNDSNTSSNLNTSASKGRSGSRKSTRIS